jgi:thioredoxin reductase (NADPH)
MLGLRAVALDCLPQVGGALRAVYPEKDIFDVPGFPRIGAADLVDDMAEQALQLGGRVLLGETVAQLEWQNSLYLLGTDRTTYTTKTVVICTGIGSFKPKRLPLSAAAAYEGRGVAYLVTDPQEYAHKRVVVVGGGDSALDLALQLAPVAQHVTLVHRSAWRAHEASVAALSRSPVQVHQPGCEVVGVHGNGWLEAVDVRNNAAGSVTTIETDALLPAIGFVSDLGAIRGWGLHLENDQIVVTPGTMATSLPGVYAAGDVALYPGKLKLIATGTAEAAQAVAQAASYINPGRKLGALVHSSNDPRFTAKQTTAAPPHRH